MKHISLKKLLSQYNKHNIGANHQIKGRYTNYQSTPESKYDKLLREEGLKRDDYHHGSPRFLGKLAEEMGCAHPNENTLSNTIINNIPIKYWILKCG